MNVLLEMLRRVDAAKGTMVWDAPSDEQQWRVESAVLMESERGPTPLLKLSDKQVTELDSGEPLGLLKHALVTLLQPGKLILTQHPA